MQNKKKPCTMRFRITMVYYSEGVSQTFKNKKTRIGLEKTLAE